MKKVLVAALATIGLAAPASAAVVTLEGITTVSNGFQFSYQGTLGPDEGVSATPRPGTTFGSRLVIFDFAGYVDGSIFTPSMNVVGTVELTTNVGPFILPPNTDDPTIENLVFTYTGPDLRTTDGPFASLNFNGLGAVSIFSQTRRDAFTTFTIKNNPEDVENTLLVQLGQDLVPTIPEPGTWAMMIGGFGIVGATMRRRSIRHVTA